MATATVLRAIVFSLLFVLALKGAQYVAGNRFSFVVPNRIIALWSLLVITVGVLGKAFLSTRFALGYFAATLTGFLLASTVEAYRRNRKQ